MNKTYIYDGIRHCFGSLNNSQVDGFEAIFNHWEKSGLSDLRWLAYMLATAWHETAKTMQPIEEFGKGKGLKYGKKVKRSGIQYIEPNKIYYGRGLVQLTWYENYQLMGRLLGVDLLRNPELVLSMQTSVEIMFEGMTKGHSSFGDFTGKCLEMYFTESYSNPLGARKIINGTDQAERIAKYYQLFCDCLKIKF